MSALALREEILTGIIADRDAEIARLRALWESLDGHLKAVRAHAAAPRGGQHVGTGPHFQALLKHPSILIELEWLTRAALATPTGHPGVAK